MTIHKNIIGTSKKHWVNGHRKYGAKFNTYAISFYNIAIMFYWLNIKDMSIQVYSFNKL